MPDFGDHQEGAGRYQYQGGVNPNDPSLANGGITPAQWAEYQARRKRDAILGTLATLGGMLGAQPLANAIGIGAGAGASAAGAGAGGALPAIEGGAPWAVTPYAGSASMVGTGLSGGAAGAAGAAGAGAGLSGAAGGAGKMFAGMTGRELAGLGAGLAGTVGSAFSDKPNFSPNSGTSDPQLQALLRTMQGRLDKSEPLYDSVLNMANGLLPMQYQKGGGG